MSRGSLPRIKLDLTVDEIVVLEPTRQRVAHPYSDEPPDGIHARCYSYAEVFGEKLRALGERGRPRDLYDVINLFRQPDALHVAEEVQRVLEAKCEFKGIPPTSLAQVEPHRAELEADWAAMLEHQLPSLPPFESFWNVLPAFFEWLERRIAAPVPAAFVRSPGEEVIRPSAGTIGRLGVPGRPLEAIRFAAANRLCVDLVYQGSTRRIEPYSLRRTADGNIVLHAERVDGQGHRTYRVDGIASAAITDQSFAPKYLIELTPSGPQSIPPTSPRPRSVSPTSRIGRTRTASTGPSYVYECNYCGKRFPRKKRDSKLRPHKDKSGYPCPGRAAFFAETKY